MKTQFANGRERLNQEDWKIEVLGGAGSLTARTCYFSLQAENQYGKNYLISSDVVAITANDAVKITIYPTARLSGEGWTQFTLGIAFTSDVTEFVQFAKLDIPTPFNVPLELTISQDNHLVDSVVSQLSNLFYNEFHGKIFHVEQTSSFYEFNEGGTPHEYTSDFIEGVLGTWVRVNSALCHVSDIAGKGGAKRDISQIKSMPNNKLLNYDMGNVSDFEVQFYLENDVTEQLNENRMISIVGLINNVDVTTYLENLLIYNVRGFVDEGDYSLRIQNSVTGSIIPEFNVDTIYESRTSIRLPDAMKSTEKLFVGIKLDFTSDELNAKVADNSSFSLNFYLVPNAVRKSPMGFLLGGNFVIPDRHGNNLRVYPDSYNEVMIKPGRAIINGFEMTRGRNGYFKILPLNTDNIRIQLYQDGDINYATTYSDVKPTRAIVSTKPHESFLSDFITQTISLNTDQKLNFQINTEKTEDNTKQLNPYFPDVIAENREYWGFSITKINLYLRFRQYDIGGELIHTEYYKKSDQYALDIINDFEINNFTGLEKIEVGTLPLHNRSLFHPGKVQNIQFVNSGLATSFTEYIQQRFAADSIEVGIAFSLVYDGTIVSDISHDVKDGAMSEINNNVFDLLKHHDYYQAPVMKSELHKQSKHKILDAAEKKAIDDMTGVIETYVFNMTNGTSYAEFVKPFDAGSSESCAWVKTTTPPTSPPPVELNNAIKQQIFETGIVFGI